VNPRMAQLHTTCRIVKWLALSFRKEAQWTLKRPHPESRKERHSVS
jgi:hypothetical protein